MPVGTYTVREQGQEKTKRRHREIGTLMELIYDDGGKAMVCKLNAEVLSLQMQTLLRANGILSKGDDAILCNVYAPKADQTAPAAAGTFQSDDADADGAPF